MRRWKLVQEGKEALRHRGRESALVGDPSRDLGEGSSGPSRRCPYQQVDFAFGSRIDYGKNVLQRDGPSLKALDAARPKPRPIG